MNPIPFTEICEYYDRVPMPHSLMAFTDVMRGLESDQSKRHAEKLKNMQNKPAPETPSLSR